MCPRDPDDYTGDPEDDGPGVLDEQEDDLDDAEIGIKDTHRVFSILDDDKFDECDEELKDEKDEDDE